MESLEHQTRRVLDRIELQFGMDRELRERMHPVVRKVLAVGADREGRKRMLQLVAQAFAHQMRVREAVDELGEALRQEINRRYATEIGIEPPNLEHD